MLHGLTLKLKQFQLPTLKCFRTVANFFVGGHPIPPPMSSRVEHSNAFSQICLLLITKKLIVDFSEILNLLLSVSCKALNVVSSVIT